MKKIIRAKKAISISISIQKKTDFF